MANKFLGEAGLGVLTEEIKKKTYVGQKLDEVLWALEYMTAKTTSSPGSNLLSSEDDVKAYSIAMLFSRTILFKDIVGDSDLDWSDFPTVLNRLTQYLSLSFGSINPLIMTTEQAIRSSAMIESTFFSPYYDNTGSTNIDEITAQEVTDKFNS